jgi:hypothetical protein
MKDKLLTTIKLLISMFLGYEVAEVLTNMIMLKSAKVFRLVGGGCERH